MAASARFFYYPNRGVRHVHFRKNCGFQLPCRKFQTLQFPSQISSLSVHPQVPPLFKFLTFNGSGFTSSWKFRTTHSSFTDKHFASIFTGAKESCFQWNFTSVDEGKNGAPLVDDNRPEIAVVLLGWLGAKTKHLRKYADLYNARGMHAVTFVASVTDVLSFDLGRKLEERIARLARELESWLTKKDGRERCLIFHTFSNTGWLAYGAILENLRDRKNLLEKIKGCVVDSGGDPKIDPKVWAAGFATALLKKNSSAIYPLNGTGETTEPTIGIKGTQLEEKKPFLVETLLLSAFENLFSFLLNLPDVNQRLTKVISRLSENQPSCPQLYLYSSGDKVIPFQQVESFLEDQRRTGKPVFSFNFGSSPHVDHYRTFPESYTSQLDCFLKECIP